MDRNPFKKISILLLLFIIAYLPTWQWMWERWFTYDSYYSHGILVPFISSFLIWQKRHILKNIRLEPSTKGIWLFLAGISIHLISLLFQVYFTSGFSMIIVLAGFTLCVYGKNMLKEILFPVIFLGFMVPLPLVMVIGMSFELKLLSAHMAAVMLNIINIPAVQEGSYIHMEHASVVVEDVCSGLRSLIALMALGALFAYWMKSGWLQKTVLFFSSIPIAIITNMLRIMILSIISEFWGIQYITGFTHGLSGILVFMLAFLFLSKVEKLLK
jgi:exosortase